MTTPTAEERAELNVVNMLGMQPHTKDRIALIAEQIRQAEQAARADERRKVVEECAQRVEQFETLKFWDQLRYRMEDAGPSVVSAIRALAKDDSEAA